MSTKVELAFPWEISISQEKIKKIREDFKAAGNRGNADRCIRDLWSKVTKKHSAAKSHRNEPPQAYLIVTGDFNATTVFATEHLEGRVLGIQPGLVLFEFGEYLSSIERLDENKFHVSHWTLDEDFEIHLDITGTRVLGMNIVTDGNAESIENYESAAFILQTFLPLNYRPAF